MPRADKLPAILPRHKRALKRFEEAAQTHEMMGAYHPDDRAEIEIEYKAAKRAMYDIFAEHAQLKSLTRNVVRGAKEKTDG